MPLPILIRVISDIKVAYNCLSDLNKILFSNQLKDDEYNDDDYFLLL